MKNRTWVFLATAVLAISIFSGCGKDDPAAAPSKALFSIWTASDNSEILDMRGATFGVGNSMGFQFTDGSTCLCSLAMSGSEASGTAILTGCAYAGGGSGDPGCATLNKTYTFTNTAAVLSLCNAGTCYSYH